MEHRAVAHVGKKVAAAQLLYGDDVAGALVEQAGVGGSFLEDLAREVVANAEIPDLGELFVRVKAGKPRPFTRQQHRALEGSGWPCGIEQQGKGRKRAKLGIPQGWLLGRDVPDLSDLPQCKPETLASDEHNRHQLNPTVATQLMLF